MSSPGQTRSGGTYGWPFAFDRLLWLDVERLLPLIVFIGIFLMAARPPFDTDTWWHLRSGQYIVETKTIPFGDPFSHTVLGALWIDCSWLAQLGLYGLYSALGSTGLVVALATIVTLAFWFVSRSCEGDPFLVAFALFLAALSSAIVWVARPQIVTFLLATVVLHILYLYKHRTVDRLGWLPVITLAWANIHGGYIVAFILIGVYLIGELLNRVMGIGSDPILSGRRIARLAVFGVLSLLAVLFNPYTYKMLGFPFYTVGMQALQVYIEEWASPDFHAIHFQPTLLLLAAVVVALALSRRRADFTDLGLIAVFTCMALVSSRNVALFALVAAPVLVRYGTSAMDSLLDSLRQRTSWGPQLDRLVARRLGGQRLLVAVNWLLVGLLAAAAVARIFLASADTATTMALEKRGAPMDAIAFLEANSLPERLFNEYNWGGLLVWRLYPRYRVYIDGRTDLYDEAFIREYLDVLAARGSWRDTLDRRKADTVLVGVNARLADALSRDASWRRAYLDDRSVVFVRLAAEERAP